MNYSSRLWISLLEACWKASLEPDILMLAYENILASETKVELYFMRLAASDTGKLYFFTHSYSTFKAP